MFQHIVSKKNMKNAISPNSPNDKYTGGHSHPASSFDIEFVSYDRFDGKHDLFIFANEFLNEEFEKCRVDTFHIFIKTLNSLGEMEKICKEVMIKLGEDFKVVPYYKEKNSRIICGKIVTYLKSINSQEMYLNSENNDWILRIRKKDFKNASKIVLSNIVEE